MSHKPKGNPEGDARMNGKLSGREMVEARAQWGVSSLE